MTFLGSGDRPKLARCALPCAVLCAFAVEAAGCRGGDAACTVRSTHPIFGGTSTTGLIDLAPSEKQAIGLLTVGPPERAATSALCTGTLIAPGWVLTAGHCAQMDTFTTRSLSGEIHAQSVGRAASDPSAEALLLEVSPGALAPETTPLALLEEVIDGTWVGEPVELGGYGLTQTDGVGDLRFVVEAITDVAAVLGILTVDGYGRSGACVGDSGGPALTRGRDGTVRLAGILLAGSSSCTGKDHYLMAEPLRSWVAETAPPVVPPQGTPCGTTTTVGRCFRQTAVWCSAAGTVTGQPCDSGRACGWDATARGFRCVDPMGDSCEGIDALGTCRDGAALRCVDGALEESSCTSCKRPCRRSPISGAVACD